WVTLAGGVLAVVAAAAGPVEVLAGGDGEGVADPAEVGDVEVALGQPLAEELAVVGVDDLDVDPDLLELGLDELLLGLAELVAGRGGDAQAPRLGALRV